MSASRAVPDLAPFRELLDEARTALARDGLRDIVSRLPDEAAAVRALNERLGGVQLRLLAASDARRWRLTVDDGDRSPVDAAALGLARLVEVDGWRRVKACARPGCGGCFIDETNGNTRKFCEQHTTAHPPRE